MSENNNQSMGDLFPDLGPEVPIISGVAHDSTESLATVRRVPNEPGMAAKVFTMLAEAGVNVDMIVQASASTGTADISFTVPGTAAAKVQEVLQEKQGELGFQSFDVDPNVGKVAVVGVGMKTHSGLAAKFFNALSDKGVNVLMISTSEIRIAALVPLEQLNDASRRCTPPTVWTPTRWKPWCTAAPAADSAGFSFPVFLRGMVLRPCPFRLLFTIHAVRCIPCQAVPKQAKGRLRRVGLLLGYGSFMRLTV